MLQRKFTFSKVIAFEFLEYKQFIKQIKSILQANIPL